MVTLQANGELQNKRDDRINDSEICTMRLCYLQDGDSVSATLPHLRRGKFSPLLDIEYIKALSVSSSERAGMDSRTPELSAFLQSTAVSDSESLKERERAAVNAHMAQSSVPPWLVGEVDLEGRGLTSWWDDKDIQGPRYPEPAQIARLYGNCFY